MKRYLLLLLLCLPVIGYGQIITTWAGGGSDGSDGVLAINAGIPGPTCGKFDKYGNYYIVSPVLHKVRKIDTNGIITTVVGTGNDAYSGDGGLAINCEINGPGGIAFDSIGNLFIADGMNNRIRKVDINTGIIITIAGTGTSGYSGDGGSALNAMLNVPNNLCFDRVGNLYISDAGNSRIRKVNTSGIITTFAGNGVYGYSGDGGQSVMSQIGEIRDVAADTNNNIYIADRALNCIRKVDNVTGIISTIAGTGQSADYLFNGDNIAASVAHLRPSMLAFDKEQNLYISDLQNHRIRKIDKLSGIITTVAGDGTYAYGGDGGLATAAHLNKPSGITFDTCGNLFITQVNDGRIRKVHNNPNCWPLNVNSLEPLTLTFTLSPNPATSQITITSSTKLKGIIVTNTVGAVVKSVVCGGEKEVVDIGELSSGMYFVKVVDVNGGVRVEKVVKL